MNHLEDTSLFEGMNLICEYCGAKFWMEENTYNCCQNGNIYLSPLSKYDEKLKSLLLYDNNFRHLIRYYNNLFCFATFKANLIHKKTKAIYNLKIQGQICHKTPNTLLPNDNEEPSCGQLYIYDNLTSVDKRLQNNENLIKEHMILITTILSDNPYAKSYKYLYQLFNIQILPNYILYFIRKNDKQKYRYNKPLTSECGAIIVSNTGMPTTYDMCSVYPKNTSDNGGTHTYLNKLSHHVDPIVFSLFFPLGDLGWSIGYTKSPRIIKNDTKNPHAKQDDESQSVKKNDAKSLKSQSTKKDDTKYPSIKKRRKC